MFRPLPVIGLLLAHVFVPSLATGFATGIATGIAAGFVSGCSSTPTDSTPAGALELFLESMSEAEDDPAARARAFALLAPETRHRLAERARLAGALSARRFEPWEMIVEGRYRLRFRPRQSRGFEERIRGDRAIVIVHGDQRSERAEVPMVREGGFWRVHLQVPSTTPSNGAVSPRPDGGTPRSAIPGAP